MSRLGGSRRPLLIALVATVCVGCAGQQGSEQSTLDEAVESSASSPAVTTAPPVPTPTRSTAAPTEPAAANGQTVTVTDVIDGDTIDTTAGRVRVIGIDTPERGECNFGPATSQLRSQIAASGNTVVLVPVADYDDTDRYGRLLRYVDAPDGTDLGRNLIGSGLAIARYDSRDGYGRHPRQDDYVALDEAVPQVPCG